MSELNTPKKPNQRDQNWLKFNKVDFALKQKRDQETGTLTFIEDLNHRIEVLGQQGFDYKTLNTLAGQAVAQKARIRGDRRYLDILDQIKTAGGVYGKTVDGMKLKWGTVRQIENEAEQDERDERARYNHERKLLLDNHKITLGELIAKKASLTDPNDIQKVEQEINDALMAAGKDGVGGDVQVYHDRLTKGLASTTQGKNRILGLSDYIDPNVAEPQSVRDYLVEILADPSTDSTETSRKQRLATAFEGMNITLNDDAKDLVKRMEATYIAPEQTDLYKSELEVFNTLEKNHLSKFGVPKNKIAKLFNQGEIDVPLPIARISQKYKLRLQRAFHKEFDSYSNKLESMGDDALYGYSEWKNNDDLIDKFQSSKGYQENIVKLIDEYDTKMKEAVDKEIGSTVKKQDNHRDIIKLKMPAKDVGPKEYEDLQRMIYKEGEAFYSVHDTSERFKKAIFGTYLLSIDYKNDDKVVLVGTDPKTKKPIKATVRELKSISNLFILDNDMQDWFDEALSGSDDPKVKQKQLEALWNWGTYLIKRRNIKILEADDTLSTKEKEERIKMYQKAKSPFPKEINNFIGAKKIIEEEVEKQENNKKKKKPKTKKLSSLSKPESVKTEKKEEKPAFQDGVLDLKVLFNRFFGE